MQIELEDEENHLRQNDETKRAEADAKADAAKEAEPEDDQDDD
jgi:hypothetical protein